MSVVKTNMNTIGKKGYTIAHTESSHRLHIIENIVSHHPEILNMTSQSSDFYFYPTDGPNRKRLIQLLSEYTGSNIEYILLTAGSDGALKLICDTFITPTSKLLIPTPTYPNMIQFIETTGSWNPEFTTKAFMDKSSNMEQVLSIQLVNNDYDLVYICSPNLPLGHTVSPAWVVEETAKYPNTIFVVDEAYMEYCEKESCSNLNIENLLITRTFSKAFGLAGLRIGYVIGPLVDRLRVIYNCKSVTLNAIRAATICMENKEYYMDHLDKLKLSRKLLKKQLSKLVQPRAMIYDFDITDAAWFFIYVQDPQYVLNIFKNSGIMVRDKSADVPNGIRIAYAKSEIMMDVIRVCELINLPWIMSDCRVIFDMDGVLRPNSHSGEFYSEAVDIVRIPKESRILSNNEMYPQDAVALLKQNNITAPFINSVMNICEIVKNNNLKPLVISKDPRIIKLLDRVDSDDYTDVVLIDDFFQNQTSINKICDILGSGGKLYITDSEMVVDPKDTPIAGHVPSHSTPGLGMFANMFETIYPGCLIDVGKPSHTISENFNLFGWDYMIGNTLETDGEFANVSGLKYIHISESDDVHYDLKNKKMVIPHIRYLILSLEDF